MPGHITRPPQTDVELWHYVSTLWGVRIPYRKVCPNHVPPFRAFADAYFARYPVTIWKASRGFGGKSTILGTLVQTEAVGLSATSTVLGGSSAQSLRVHAVTHENWENKNAPKAMLSREPTQFVTRLTNGATITALMASQKSARGPHPQRLRLDEIDEMDLDILEAAQGQPMEKIIDGTLVEAQTVMSSTHQYPTGTMTTMLGRAKENGWPVYEWCWRESLQTKDNPAAWLTPRMVQRKKMEVSRNMWRTEYDLQEPSFEGRAIDTELVDWAFQPNRGEYEGVAKHTIIIEEPQRYASYVTGVDWAKERDMTVISTFRTDQDPWVLVAWARVNRNPWPIMIRMLDDRLDQYGGMCAHDATGIGNVVADLLQHKAKDVVLTGRTRTDVLGDYIAAIENKRIVFPRIKYVYDEHRYVTNDDLFGSGHAPDTVVSGALAWSMRNRNTGIVMPVVEEFERAGSPWEI